MMYGAADSILWQRAIYGAGYGARGRRLGGPPWGTCGGLVVDWDRRLCGNKKRTYGVLFIVEACIHGGRQSIHEYMAYVYSVSWVA